MADTAELKIKITAEISKATTEFARLQNSTKKLRDGLNTTAKRATIAFAGLATVIGLTTKAFGDFENQMLSVKTLMIDVSTNGKDVNATFKQMSADALNLASDVPVGIGAMTTALFDTVSAGVDAGKAVAFVGKASKLAVAGATDVSVATDGMTSAFNAWGESAGTANDIAGKFFTAQKFGKTTVADLAGSIGEVSAQASEMGVSLDETLASVSALTLGGVRTSEAFTEVRGILTAIVKPSDQASKLAKKLGIDFSEAGLKAKGFQGFLNEVREATGGNAEQLATLFGRVEALNGAMALSGKQAKNFDKVLKELGNTEKVNETLTEAYKEQSLSLNNQVKLLKNGIKILSIELGTEFAPMIRNLVSSMTDFVKAFRDLTPAHKKAIGNTILFVAKMTLAVAIISKVSAGVIVARNALLAFRATTIATTIATSAFLATVLPWIGAIALVVAGLTALADKLLDVRNNALAFNASDEGIIKKHEKEIARLEKKNKKLDKSSEAYQKNINRIKVLTKAIEGLNKQSESRRIRAEQPTDITGAPSGTPSTSSNDDIKGAEAKQEVLNKNLKAFLEAQGETTSAYDQKTIERLNGLYTTKEEMQSNHLDAMVAKANDANAEMVKNDQMTADKKLEIAVAEAQARLALASTAFGSLTALMGSNNRILFEIGKASAIAQMGIQIPLTAMNVYSGFVKAFGAPVGQILGIAGAISSVAFGATKLAEISSTQFNPKGAKEGVFDFRASGNNENLITTLSAGESIMPKTMTDAVRSGEANIGGDTVLNLNIGEVIGLNSQDVADKIAQTMNEAMQSGVFKAQVLQGSTS